MTCEQPTCRMKYSILHSCCCCLNRYFFFLHRDCCHSGTVLDLPYRFSADDSKMRLDQNMNMNSFLASLGGAQQAICCAFLGLMLVDMIMD